MTWRISSSAAAYRIGQSDAAIGSTTLAGHDAGVDYVAAELSERAAVLAVAHVGTKGTNQPQSLASKSGGRWLRVV